MNQQFQLPQAQNRKPLLVVNQFTLCKYTNKKSEIIAQGKCCVYCNKSLKDDQLQVEFATYNFTIFSSQPIIKTKREGFTIYLFEIEQNQLYKLQIQDNLDQTANFEEIFTQIQIKQQKLPLEFENLQTNIFLHYAVDQLQLKQFTMQTQKNTIVKSFSNKISSLFTNPSTKTNTGQKTEVMNTKFDSNANKESISKWSVREKSQQINDELTKLFKPVVDKFRQIENRIGQSFMNSENKAVTKIKQRSLALADLLNQSFKKINISNSESKQGEQQTKYQLR